jgi:hypothetical protein
MAAEGDMDKEVAIHRRGYEAFIRLLKVGAIASFIVAMIVVLLIAK